MKQCSRGLYLITPYLWQSRPGVYDVGTVTKMESLAQNMGVGQMVLLSAEMRDIATPTHKPSIKVRGEAPVFMPGDLRLLAGTC